MRKAKTFIIFLLAVVFSFSAVVLLAVDKPSEEMEKIEIAMVIQWATHPWAAPIQAGLMDAVQEFRDMGIEVETQWLGPPTFDLFEMIAMIETIAAKGEVDGFVIGCEDPTAIYTLGERIKDELGIPILITNDFHEYELFDSFCGYDGFAMGELVAKQLEQDLLGKSDWAMAVGYKGSDPIKGKIAFTIDAPGHRPTENAARGGRDYFSKFPGIVDVGLYDTTNDMVKAKEVITDIFTAHPDLAGFHSFGSTTTRAVGLVLEDRGLEGKVAVTGGDIDSSTLEHIQSRTIGSAVGQNQYQQGYQPTKALLEYLVNNKPIPKMIPVELEVVDMNNADEFAAREKAWVEQMQ
jgi:ABC-type sugar transport system substrate-binding protein